MSGTTGPLDQSTEILAIVPARGGSKGIPRKNTRPLAGEALIGYTLRAAQASRHITRLIVSTDDQEIADMARSYNVEVPFVRPKDLASDEASQVDVVLHALREIERLSSVRYDIVLLLQPTTPLRSTADIDEALGKLVASGADSVVSFHRVSQGHPYYMYTLIGDRPEPLLQVPRDISRRQQFPYVYVRNGAIYAVRRDVLVKEKSFYGRDVRAYVMSYERSINIDTEVDLMVAEVLLRYRLASEKACGR